MAVFDLLEMTFHIGGLSFTPWLHIETSIQDRNGLDRRSEEDNSST